MTKGTHTTRRLVANATAMLALAALAAAPAAAQPGAAVNQRAMEQAAESAPMISQRQLEAESSLLGLVNQRQMELAAEGSSGAANAPDNRADRGLPAPSAGGEITSAPGSSGFPRSGAFIGIAAALALIAGTTFAARRRGKAAHA